MSTRDQPGFTSRTFELLVGLHVMPTKRYYQAHQAEFKSEVDLPFQRAFLGAAERLPLEIHALLETKRGLFSRILKNDWGQGGAWDHYWAALYPKGSRRITGLQVLASINHEGLLCGFYVSPTGSEQRARLGLNGTRYVADLHDWAVGREPEPGSGDRLAAFLANPAAEDFFLPWGRLSDEQAVQISAEALSDWLARRLTDLFPLALLALLDDPLPAIESYLEHNPSAPGSD
jgi:hypothetical protein